MTKEREKISINLLNKSSIKLKQPSKLVNNIVSKPGINIFKKIR